MRLREGRWGQFYSCTRYPVCRGTHGAHEDGRPLGIPGDARTKALRLAAHAAFDRLWTGRGWKRPQAYRWLARQLGIAHGDCHIAMFDAETCIRVAEVCHDEETRPLERRIRRRGGRGRRWLNRPR